MADVNKIENSNTNLYNAASPSLAKKIVEKMGSLFDQNYMYRIYDDGNQSIRGEYDCEGIITNRNAHASTTRNGKDVELTWGQQYKDGTIEASEYYHVANHDRSDEEMTRYDIQLRENKVTGENKPIDITDRELKTPALKGWKEFLAKFGNGGERVSYNEAIVKISQMPKEEQEALARDLGVTFEAPPAVPDEKDKKLAEMQKQLEDLKKANEAKDKELEGAKKKTMLLQNKINNTASTTVTTAKTTPKEEDMVELKVKVPRKDVRITPSHQTSTGNDTKKPK